jgi:hypothetical protein
VPSKPEQSDGDHISFRLQRRLGVLRPERLRGRPDRWSGLNWLTESPKQCHLDSSGQRHNDIVWGDWRLDLRNSTLRHEAKLELHGRRRFLCHVPHSRDSGRSQLPLQRFALLPRWRATNGGAETMALRFGIPPRWPSARESTCVQAAPADQSTPEGQQRLVDIGPLLVAHSQSAELI